MMGCPQRMLGVDITSCRHAVSYDMTGLLKIKTSPGRYAVLCSDCMDAMMSRLADRNFLAGMMRAAMPGDEHQRMLREREAMRAEL